MFALTMLVPQMSTVTGYVMNILTPTMLVPKMSTVTGYDNVSPDLAPLARPGECT